MRKEGKGRHKKKTKLDEEGPQMRALADDLHDVVEGGNLAVLRDEAWGLGKHGSES